MPLLVIGLVALLVLGYRDAKDEMEACRDAKTFTWFQNGMRDEDAVIRDIRPSIPDADRATRFLSLSLEYQAARRVYRALGHVMRDRQAGPLPWDELERSLENRVGSTEYIARVYKDSGGDLSPSERQGIDAHRLRIEMADADLLLRAQHALRGMGFDVQPDGRFVVRC